MFIRRCFRIRLIIWGWIWSWLWFWSRFRRWSIAMITRIIRVTIWCISYSYYLVQIIWSYCFTTGYGLISVVSRNYWSFNSTKGIAIDIPRTWISDFTSHLLNYLSLALGQCICATGCRLAHST